MPANIVVFLGTVRPGRMVERVGTAVKNIVSELGMEPIVIDPAEHPFEVVKSPIHFMKDPEKEAPEWLLEMNTKIQNADGFIVVSAEYNCGIPPALANVMDHFPPASYRHRPCGIVTYSPGSFGGCRVPLILRPFISELGMVSTPTGVSIPNVHQAIEADGKPDERIGKNLTKLVKEVGWYADALKTHKGTISPPQ